MNIYRGCSHGCIYCDSRSRCYQFTHPFEDIEVKQNAPELLEVRYPVGRGGCREQQDCVGLAVLEPGDNRVGFADGGGVVMRGEEKGCAVNT